jgi:hypothetical protein
MRTTPHNLCVETHLYTQYDDSGGKDVSLEREFFAILDGAADRVIETMVQAVRNGRTPALTLEEKEVWDLFFYYQWKRVPDVLNEFGPPHEVDNHIRELIQEYEKTRGPLTPDERERMQDPEVLARIKHNARVSAVARPGRAVLDILANRGVGIAATRRRNKSFIIGSRPNVKFTFPGRTHLADDSVEVWLPVASDVAVTPARSRREVALAYADDRTIRAINAAIFKQSTVVACRSEALIESLISAR